MTLKVSVIVPVHNAGPALELAITSSLCQSMPADQYEVIFIDDGSTDGSGQRLDEVAATHPNVTVVHTAASGSPGPPRNLGIERARGEYIQFLDADDRLGERALERQYAMAREHDADIVIGKLGSNFRGVHWSLFRRNIEEGTLATAPVMWNLTVCKMFRTSFLREHGIRFPVGWSRIEDEHFVVRSYLKARTISVVADEPCYFYCGRDDGGNLTSQPLDPDAYYANLGEILALIDRHMPSGRLRADFKRRFYHVEMLGRLVDGDLLAMDAAGQARRIEAMRRLDLARIEDDVRDGLPAVYRVLSRLLRDGRTDDLVAFAARSEEVTLRAAVTSVEATAHGVRFRYRAEVRWADGSPFVLTGAGPQRYLDPRLVPADLAGTDTVAVDRASLLVQAAMHEQDGWLDWMLKPASRVRLVAIDRRFGEGAVTPIVDGSVTIDPDLPGPSARSLTAARWALMVRLRGTGLDLRAITSAPAAVPAISAILVDPPGVATTVARDGVLELTVAPGVDAIAALLRERPPVVLATGRRLRIRLPAVVGPGGRAHLALTLRPAADPVVTVLPTTVTARPSASAAAELDAEVPPGLPAGPTTLWLQLGGGERVPIGAAEMRGDEIVAPGLPSRGLASRAVDELVDGATRALGAARQLAVRVKHRLRRPA